MGGNSFHIPLPFSISLRLPPTVWITLSLENILPKLSKIRGRPVTTHKTPIRLTIEKSLYMLQQNQNPVDW